MKKVKSPVDKDRQVDQNLVEKMRAAGYEPIDAMAAKVHLTVTTLGRWADAGQIKTMVHAHRKFVLVSSVVAKIGPEKAEIFGLSQKRQPQKAEGARKQ